MIWELNRDATWVVAALGALNLLALGWWFVSQRFRVVLVGGARRRSDRSGAARPAPSPKRSRRRAAQAAEAADRSPGEARLAEDLKSWRSRLAAQQGAIST